MTDEEFKELQSEKVKKNQEVLDLYISDLELLLINELKIEIPTQIRYSFQDLFERYFLMRASFPSDHILPGCTECYKEGYDRAKEELDDEMYDALEEHKEMYKKDLEAEIKELYKEELSDQVYDIAYNKGKEDGYWKGVNESKSV